MHDLHSYDRNRRAVKAGLTEDERSQLTQLCGRCLWHSLQTCVRVRGLGESTFVGELNK